MKYHRAADHLLAGGVIAYPTEGVFGLGCMPDDSAALVRLLVIKRRDPAKGLILIAGNKAQLGDWIAADDIDKLPDPDAARPTTWIVQPDVRVSPLIRGIHKGVAVRITTHPVAAKLCAAVCSPIVSTSANISGRPVARNRFLLRRQFARLVDYIVPGDCGQATGASEIRDISSGKVLRAGQP